MYRFLCLLLFGIFCFPGLNAQVRMTQEEYIEKYKTIAIAHMEKYGIPASITMAQGLLESDSGNSDLARASNNHFGIKCKKNWTGRKVYHDDDAKGECFRAYPSVEASYLDHAEFLDSSPRYDSLFSYPSDDYKSWARGLKAAGYATAPDYATRLVGIIEKFRLYLLDRGVTYDYHAFQPSETEIVTTGTATEPAEPKVTPLDSSSSVPEVAYVDKGVNPDAFRVTINSYHGYDVYKTNGVHYVIAKKGDTFDSLGEIFQITPKTLRKLNDLSPNASLHEDDIVYIAKKKSRWEGNVSHHRVSKGETLHSISQLYGIRQRSLSKINHLYADEGVCPEQEILLR